MEALWDLEDKLKISTLGAVLLLACASLALVCLCIVVTLRRKAINNKIVHQEGALDEENEKNTTITNTNTNFDATITTTTTTPTEWSKASCVGWISVKRVLMGSMLWSKARKLEENIAWQRERGSPLLGLQRQQGLQSGWQSHNSESPVWQRPILRGEKCELPSFSGLILYDERGRLLRDSQNQIHHFMETSQQEVGTVTVRTTLRDLL
ncbi:uncharacterized protein LOC124833326 [Vigna umbellata]|uniref:uncharacterized protein LOC124833326 n=1 Tax=Vigna umbellata TaxID=87088 RepID=UPI001F5FC4A2|nr:uncharacterized protein LOC124833326 [Vigna umbellata]